MGTNPPATLADLRLASTNGGRYVFSYTDASSSLTNGHILVNTDASFPYKRLALSVSWMIRRLQMTLRQQGRMLLELEYRIHRNKGENAFAQSPFFNVQFQIDPEHSFDLKSSLAKASLDFAVTYLLRHCPGHRSRSP